MKRLNILVEGQTEENFVRDVLTDHLFHYGVHVYRRSLKTGKTRRINSSGNRETKEHKGGGVTYQRLRDDLTLWRKQDQDAILTTMIDFYGLKNDFPKSNLPSNLAIEKVEALEAQLASDFRLANFIPYVQMHEFEALLFSDVQILNEIVSTDSLPNPKTLQSLLEIRAQSQTPEHINDSPLTAPSKRLAQVYEGRYGKTEGNIVASLIGLATIRRECRHFDTWLTKLENLNSQGAS